MKRIAKLLVAISLLTLVAAPAAATPDRGEGYTRMPEVVANIARVAGDLVLRLFAMKLGPEIDPNGGSDAVPEPVTDHGTAGGLGPEIDPSG